MKGYLLEKQLSSSLIDERDMLKFTLLTFNKSNMLNTQSFFNKLEKYIDKLIIPFFLL